MNHLCGFLVEHFSFVLLCSLRLFFSGVKNGLFIFPRNEKALHDVLEMAQFKELLFALWQASSETIRLFTFNKKGKCATS